MALTCSYIPYNKKGEKLDGFHTYRKELGYQMAAKVFTQVLSPSFQEDYKKFLEFDGQGVPTFSSAIKVPYIKNLIGNTKLINTDQKEFLFVENTRENYQRLLTATNSYNLSSDNRDVLVAIVTPSENGEQIRVEIREKTEENLNEFRNQYSTFFLNQRLEQLFGNIGVNVDLLERNELTNGFVDFSKASSIADGFKGLINIANGMEGELALSEEFAHLLIGMFRDTPLIQRSLQVLTNSEDICREVLGDEYQNNRDYYEQHPNYDSAGNMLSTEESLAEEALGRILQEKLTTSDIDNSNEESKPLHNLIQRLINWIKKTFKGKNADEVTKAKNEVDTTMSELAKDVLSGTKKLSKEQILKNQRNARFNHLKENTDKVLKLLNNAVEIERKRSKIAPKEQVEDIKNRIIKLESLLTDKNKLEGVHNYAKWALTDLQNAMNQLDVSGTLEQKDFTALRHIKSVLDSYTGFISEFHEALDEMGDDFIVEINGEEVNLKELWRDIDDLYKSCDTAFKKQSFAAFSDFLAPIYNNSPLRNKDGSIKTLDEVLAGEDFDISEFDRWLTSMGESSSVLLQLFDKAVKNAKDNVRERNIDSVRKIWSIRDKAEKKGITSFEWMYEKDKDGHKTGNYISKFNHGQFEKDREEMQKRLIEKYGKHPVGEDYNKYRAEKKAWYDEHADYDIFGSPFPGKQYRNRDYEKLTQAQKDILEEILQYKDSLEALLPPNKRNHVRAIQRRRSSSQRLFDTLSNPEQAYQAIKDDISSALTRSEDDDLLYGERTQGLTDFTGQEYLTLPILYTNKLKNPDTLSTDIFSDLMLYAHMAATYDEMSKIYDPLEIGVNVVAQKEFVKNAGSKAKEEVINALGRVSRKSIKVGSNTNFAKKLRDYLECQVYGRYMKEDDILGLKTQKALGLFQRLSSTAYLGCNYLAGVANIVTAQGMQRIEAFSGEFFNYKQLVKADIEYGKMIPEFIAELTNREKQSKLALFDELFDVRQNAKDKLHNVQMKNIYKRFFGNNWLFIQQGLGDHWIYNRTALAMAFNRKVKVKGKEMSVWDALEIVTDEYGYKKMKVKEGTKNLDGTDFSAKLFGREIAHINHTVAGIYNDDDQNAANRVMIGRLAQQMRKWIIPQMMRRFQSKRMVLDIGREEEGYYRTFGKLAADIWKSGFKITSEWDKLDKSEKANIRRALTEIAQTYSLWLIVSMLGSGVNDPDRSWAAKFAEYMLHRETHELGFLTPGPMMLTEGYKTITSPFVAASAADKIAQAMMTTMWPGNWFPSDDELIKSGRYEGHSHIYKRWMELPLPPMTQKRQIEKFLDDLDTGTKFYSRDYK